MKKQLLRLSVLLFAYLLPLPEVAAAATVVTLPFYETFNYNEGSLNTVTPFIWVTGNGTTTEISVSNSAALPAPVGYPASSGKGVSRSPSGTARRSVLQFSSVPAAEGTTIYVSLLLAIQSPPTSAQIIGFLDNNSSSQGSPQMGIFIDGSSKVGIGKKSSAPGFTSPGALGAGAHLVVARYTFQAGNDRVDLWVDPSPGDYGAATAPASLGGTTGSTEPPSLDYFQLVTSSGAGGLEYIDEFRIGATWADAVPAGGPLVGQKLGFSTPPSGAAPGATLGPVVVQVQTTGGFAVASNGVPVTLTLSAGAGALGGTLIQNTDASGKATFNNLTIDTVGNDKQITATASGIGAGLTAAASSTFAIAVPTVGSKLAFTTPPADAQANAILSPVVVQVQDPNGIAAASNNVPITVSLNVGGGTMYGTLTRNTDAGGKATFNDLRLDTAGAGKILTATASGIGAGLASVASTAFAITTAPTGGTGGLVITSQALADPGLVVNGAGDTAGAFVQILGANEPDTVASNWVIISYQNFNASGRVSFTNPVSPAMPHTYYRLRTGDTTTKLQPPSIGIAPVSQIVSAGSTATFSLVATGPMLQYLWTFNGKAIAGANGSSLSLTNAQAANVGNYNVIVANPAGNVTSATVTLGVGNVAPSLISPPQDQTVTVGGSAIFSVTANGTSPLGYQWYYNTNTLLAGKTARELALNTVSLDDAGGYSVVVSNAFGTLRSGSGRLTVNAVPTAPIETNVMGFAGGVTGGAGGQEVFAADYAALRAYCRQAGPLIIHVQGQITPNEAYCYVEQPNKTIIGDGTNAAILGDLRMASTNIIVQNLFFSATAANSDGVTVDNNSHGTGKYIWVDHCTFYACSDGSVDVTKGGDYVTVSWCKFYYEPVPDGVVNHEFVHLIASSDSDNLSQYHVTFHHNWYHDYCRERMPSVRFGRVHVFNNYYDCAGNNYCVRTRINAEVLVENNYYLGVQNPWEKFITTGSDGLLHASGNITNNCRFVSGWVSGAVVIPGTDTLTDPTLTSGIYPYTLTPAADIPYYVQTYAGSGKYPYVAP